MAQAMPLVPQATLAIQRGLPRSTLEALTLIGSGLSPTRAADGTFPQIGSDTAKALAKSTYDDAVAREGLIDPSLSGEASAFIFDMAAQGNEQGFRFKASIEFATSTEGGQANRMTGTLYGVTRQQIERIPVNAAIQLLAGYLGGFPVSKDTVFYGTLDYAVPSREGGVLTWEFSATMNPDAILDAYVGVARRRDEKATFGEVMTQLLNPFGVVVRLPDIFFGKNDDGSFAAATRPSADGSLIGDYQSTKGAITEFRDLLKRFNDIVGASFLEVPDTAKFFSILIVDGSGMLATEIFEIDLDSPYVTSVSPTKSAATAAESNLPPTTLLGVADIFRLTSVEGMQIQMALDPRARVGQVAQWPPTTGTRAGDEEASAHTDFGHGSMVIDAVRHDVDGWSTTIEGKLLEGDFLKPAA